MSERTIVEGDIEEFVAKLTQLVDKESKYCELMSCKILGKKQQLVKVVIKIDVRNYNRSEKLSLDPFQCLKSLILGRLKGDFSFVNHVVKRENKDLKDSNAMIVCNFNRIHDWSTISQQKFHDIGYVLNNPYSKELHDIVYRYNLYYSEMVECAIDFQELLYELLQSGLIKKAWFCVRDCKNPIFVPFRRLVNKEAKKGTLKNAFCLPVKKQLIDILLTRFKTKIVLDNAYREWIGIVGINFLGPEPSFCGLYYESKESILKFLMYSFYGKIWDCELKIWSKYLSYKVNAFIELRQLHPNYGMEPSIFVNNEYFPQLSYLLINDAKKGDVGDNVRSIDEIVAHYRDLLGLDEGDQDPFDLWEIYAKLSPKEIFWGYCSNFQIWRENNYNADLLHFKIAFPLLKKLLEGGDPLAKKVYKNEVIKKIESNFSPAIEFLIEGNYLEGLNFEENPELSKKVKYLKYQFYTSNNFVKCPVCNNYYRSSNGLKVKRAKEKLVGLETQLKKFNLKIKAGIACCDCYKKL